MKAFYLRRVLRIFPVYYLYLLVLAISQAFILYDDEASTWIGALTFTRNVIGQGDSATGHLWSLAIEEQFYLIWPCALVIFALPTQRKLAISILAAVVITSILARAQDCQAAGFICRYILHPKSILNYADCLAIGCIGAFIRISYSPNSRLAWLMAYGGTTTLILSTLISPSGRLTASIMVSMQAAIVIAAMIGTASLPRSAIKNILESRPLVFLGTISYSLYIWHMLFLRHYVGPSFPLGLAANWQFWWIGSIFAATASYFLYERRFVMLGRRWRR